MVGLNKQHLVNGQHPDPDNPDQRANWLRWQIDSLANALEALDVSTVPQELIDTARDETDGLLSKHSDELSGIEGSQAETTATE